MKSKVALNIGILGFRIRHGKMSFGQSPWGNDQLLFLARNHIAGCRITEVSTRLQTKSIRKKNIIEKSQFINEIVKKYDYKNPWRLHWKAEM